MTPADGDSVSKRVGVVCDSGLRVLPFPADPQDLIQPTLFAHRETRPGPQQMCLPDYLVERLWSDSCRQRRDPEKGLLSPGREQIGHGQASTSELGGAGFGFGISLSPNSAS